VHSDPGKNTCQQAIGMKYFQNVSGTKITRPKELGPPDALEADHKEHVIPN
jgi:hypothetical protein